MTDIHSAKKTLRRQLRSKWNTVSKTERANMSLLALNLMRGRPEWQQATNIMMFVPLEDELDIWPLVTEALNSGRVVGLPRFNPTKQLYEAAKLVDRKADLAPGFRGIPEPKPECPVLPFDAFDLVLVPGLGFDCTGARLGRGKGCYDQILANVTGTKCGVGMDWQVVPSIPVAAHDQRVDFILTPTRWIECARSCRSTLDNRTVW